MKDSQKEAIKDIIKSGRYTYDPNDGGIFSHVIKDQPPFKLSPSTGGNYDQLIYCLWTDKNERLMVYGHHFTWFYNGYDLNGSDQVTFRDGDKKNTRIENLKLRYNKEAKRQVVRTEEQRGPKKIKI